MAPTRGLVASLALPPRRQRKGQETEKETDKETQKAHTEANTRVNSLCLEPAAPTWRMKVEFQQKKPLEEDEAGDAHPREVEKRD